MGSKQRSVVLGFLLVLAFVLGERSEAKPLSINARSAIVVDMTDGQVLYEENADGLIAPASITKILTLYIVFEAIEEGRLQVSDKVRVSSRAAKTGGSSMCLRAGEEVPLEEIIQGMAVVSGNDACVAVAEHMSGSVEAFVAGMNAKARQIGLTRSHFETPNGLPARGQLTTARDISRLSMAYLRRFPESLSIHSMRAYTYNNVTHRNANRLLGRCSGVDGLKTGFVCASGYNLSATAKRGDVRLLAVVLGAPSPGIRAAETTKLLEFGFQQVAPHLAEPLYVEEMNAGDGAGTSVCRQVVKKKRGAGKVRVAGTTKSVHKPGRGNAVVVKKKKGAPVLVTNRKAAGPEKKAAAARSGKTAGGGKAAGVKTAKKSVAEKSAKPSSVASTRVKSAKPVGKSAENKKSATAQEISKPPCSGVKSRQAAPALVDKNGPAQKPTPQSQGPKGKKG